MATQYQNGIAGHYEAQDITDEYGFPTGDIRQVFVPDSSASNTNSSDVGPAAPLSALVYGPPAPASALVYGPPTPKTAMVGYNPILEDKSIDPELLKTIDKSIPTSSYNLSDYVIDNSSGESGPMAPEIHTVNKDIGNNLQAAYDPLTGNLQTIYYKDQSQGGYWNPQGQFVPYQSSGGGFGSFLSGMFSGIKDLATSDMVKTLAPMIISGGLGGGAGVGNALGIGSTAGGALVGAGTSALAGGDVLKGALMGGLGGASNVAIGDTGVTVGDALKGVKTVQALNDGNVLAALSSVASMSNVGNTKIGDTGFTINDAAKDLNIANAIVQNRPDLLMNTLVAVTKAVGNSPAASVLNSDAPLSQSDLDELDKDQRAAYDAGGTSGLKAYNAQLKEQSNADKWVDESTNQNEIDRLKALYPDTTAKAESTAPVSGGLSSATAESTTPVSGGLSNTPTDATTTAAVQAPAAFDYQGLNDALNSNIPGFAQQYIKDNNLTTDDLINKGGLSEGILNYYGVKGAEYTPPEVASTATNTGGLSSVVNDTSNAVNTGGLSAVVNDTGKNAVDTGALATLANNQETGSSVSDGANVTRGLGSDITAKAVDTGSGLSALDTNTGTAAATPKFNTAEFMDALNSGAGQAFINANNLSLADIENQAGFSQGQMDYYGLHGSDYVAPAEVAGKDTMTGGAANDTLAGSSGADTVKGGATVDTMTGATGLDTLVGSTGLDTVAGGAGVDTVSGGAGVDTVVGSSGADTVAGGNNAAQNTVVQTALDPMTQLARDNGYSTYEEYQHALNDQFAKDRSFPDYATYQEFGGDVDAYKQSLGGLSTASVDKTTLPIDTLEVTGKGGLDKTITDLSTVSNPAVSNVDSTKVVDTSPLDTLKKLENLEVTGKKVEPALVDLTTENPAAKTTSTAVTNVDPALTRSVSTTSPLDELKKLENLEVTGKKVEPDLVDLSGLGSTSGTSNLESKKVADTSPLDTLKKLENLEVTGKKVGPDIVDLSTILDTPAVVSNTTTPDTTKKTNETVTVVDKKEKPLVDLSTILDIPDKSTTGGSTTVNTNIPELVITAKKDPVDLSTISDTTTTKPAAATVTTTTPAVTTSTVTKPKTTTQSNPITSLNFADAKLDTSPQFLAGKFSPTKQLMKLNELRQLFDSLHPDMKQILSERDITPPSVMTDETDKNQDNTMTPEEQIRLNTTTFAATGGLISSETQKLIDSMTPKYVQSQPTLAAAPVTQQESRLGVLKHLAQGPLKGSKLGSGLAHGGLPHKYAQAAPKGHKPEFITGLTGYYAQGGGTGQSDDIPAMLHDGDFVIDADTVAALGDGSSKAGAEVLEEMRNKIPYHEHHKGHPVPAQIADGEYVFPAAFVTAIGGGSNKVGAERLNEMREKIRAHKRSAPTSKIPPKAKSPLDYLKMAKG